MTQQPTAVQPGTVVIHSPPIVDATLLSLDLNRSVLWNAAIVARNYASTLTENNPWYSHSQITGAAVRTLRDGLTPKFRPETRNGLAITTHVNGSFTILVVRGTPDTGDPSPQVTPRNAHRRGEKTYELFIQQSQLTFASMGSPTPRMKVLLYHIDPTTMKIRLELSEPRQMKLLRPGDYYFSDWTKRIIIPPLPPASAQNRGANTPGGWTRPIAPAIKRKKSA